MGRAGGSTPRAPRVELAFVTLMIGLAAIAPSVLSAAGMPPSSLASPAQSTATLVPVSAVPDPAHPTEGAIVTVTATVENRGGTTATGTIDLMDRRPNGDSINLGPTALPAPIAAGSSLDVRLQPFLATGVGDHTLTVVVRTATPSPEEGRLSFTMAVLPKTTQPPPPDGVGTRGLGTIETLAIVFFVAGATVLGSAMAFRRPRGRDVESLDPPPPEPEDRSPPPIGP